MNRDAILRLAFRMLIAAPVAILVYGFWCLFHADSEAGTLLLAMLGGVSGGGAGSFGPDWKLSRFVSSAISGLFLSLVFYYAARGVALRASAPPGSVRACAVAAFSFLAGITRTSAGAGTLVSRIARCATILLTLGYASRGIAFLCR